VTLEERPALAREIAARTKPRFVVDTSREEARQARFTKAEAADRAAGKGQVTKTIGSLRRALR
jgi:hypothetical protein